MYVIRPINETDLDALEKFAFGTTLGMLSLPKDRSLLKKKITRSMQSFVKNVVVPENELYLFVLEDLNTRSTCGSCGIYAKTGIEHPLYYFQIEVITNKINGLPLPKETKILHPLSETNGPSELCALFLDQGLRKEHLGELLSRSRYLFISQHLNRFDKQIVARLRGFINKAKMTSPFWEGLGKHFLEMEFVKTQDLLQSGVDFVPEFLPQHPIYVSLLPKQAQYVMQKTHVSTRPALKMLKKEGFQLTNQIDVFEAGPVVSSITTDIYSVKTNTTATVSEITKTPFAAQNYIISNTSLDFRACCSKLKLTKNKMAILPEEAAAALKIRPGDQIRYIKTHRK